MVSSNETNNRVKGRNGEETGVCVHMCVCSSTWVGVWYWSHRVSGVCYGAEMDITEQEGAGQPRLFPYLEILDGVSRVC